MEVFVINLKRRIDRKEHTINQFKNKSEFNLTIVEAIEHQNGAIGLWQTFRKILKNAKQLNEEFIIICEDDHLFTSHYNKEILLKAVEESKRKGADVLLGGVSWFDSVLQIDKGLFWTNRFNATQFTIIYKWFYDKLLEADFTEYDTADIKISSLTDSVMVMYPFISIQKEFGYSDVTSKNGEEGYVENLFENRANNLQQLNTVASYYEIKFK